jgi:universal stress protein A
MVVLKSILVATDFSEPSSVALDYGRDLARAYGATLHVLHIVPDVLLTYNPEIGFAAPLMEEDLATVARRDLDALITDDDLRTLTVVPEVRSHPNPAAGIVAYADAERIDLIVVGTHGRGALRQLLDGSTAERVVRTAPCPVLAVREHERDFLAPDALAVKSDVAPGARG